jgi:hypothetical protein
MLVVMYSRVHQDNKLTYPTLVTIIQTTFPECDYWFIGGPIRV